MSGGKFSFILLGYFKAFMVREKNINWQIVVWFSAYFSFEKKGGGGAVSLFPPFLSLRKKF